ncbi:MULTISPECIES: LptF/LptG family permease [unclassified Rickettsia]|uniref:LptF/LptG family permease n=1 Tax=unclassified Rickettsia TaxID=114295 RepID=UPI00209CAC97|nr:LptF/LptG family permease [Rickettsia endosymbiont of Ceutorhynchus assimilis]
MLLYQKYFIRSIFPLLITVTFSVTSLVWITQILKLLYLFDKGIKITDFFNLIILVLPSLLFVLLPIITVIAVIYTYNDLKTARQLIILQASGVNNLQLAKPALYIALIVTLFAYYLSSTAMPLSYINLKSRLSFIKNNYISNMIEEKIFNKISKDITIYIDKKLANNIMSGLIVFDSRNLENPSILFAESGTLSIYDNDPVFELDKGIRQIYDNNGNLTQLSFNALIVRLSSDNPLAHERNKHNRDINEYYIKELLQPDTELLTQKKIKLIAEGHQRLLWPLYNFALTFLALAVFFKYPYSRKSTLIPVLLAALSVLAVTSLHFTLQNFASKDLSFIFPCYLNIFVAIVIGLYLFLCKSIS